MGVVWGVGCVMVIDGVQQILKVKDMLWEARPMKKLIWRKFERLVLK